MIIFSNCRFVDNGRYRLLNKDPGQSFRKKMHGILRKVEADNRLSRQFLLSLCPTHFQVPHLFGLPKVHKSGVPLRPIVSQINSLFSGLSRYLADVLKPLMKKVNLLFLILKMERTKLHSDSSIMDGLLVSFDVESFFQCPGGWSPLCFPPSSVFGRLLFVKNCLHS